MTLVDLPGIGETPQHDQEYRTLYRQLLPELDLIIWILRADERAYAADIAMHQFLLNEGADPRAFCLFSAMPIACFLLKNGIPQKNARPSPGTLTGNCYSPGGNPVPFIISGTPRCCACGWNLPALVSLMIHALPSQATSAVYSHIWRKTALNRPGNSHNRLLVMPSGKALTMPLPDSVSGLDVTASA